MANWRLYFLFIIFILFFAENTSHSFDIQHIFNTSLSQSSVPVCFTSTTIVPVLKKPSVTGLNDYCSIALTSIIMKRFERLQLTLDPNTANNRLSLSEGNRKVRRGAEQLYPDHPERFDCRPQVLCRESLTGRCYWEAEWSGGGAWIAVTYKGIGRKGDSDDCRLGANDKSWSLICSPDSYSVRHNNKMTVIPIKPSGSCRVGVYLDWAAGTLSFYRVSSDGLTLLYSFTSSFTEPLCPGFGVNIFSPVSLCMLG
ncbi:stonustoxin subunit beta-like [Paramormyrops kingsleyae]|uniref:stonustoxin subunit beta-like n=1 Tax=Paramormyrops kingsleyae TaxID=1676925 RepID=UPI003B97C19C